MLPTAMAAFVWVFTSLAALGPLGFEHVADKHGVSVWKRKVPSGVELAAEGVVAAPPAKVLAVLADYPAHPRWNKHLRECRVLSRSATGLTVYERLDLPVLDDRDYTLAVEWGDDAGTLWLRFATTDAGPPPVRGVVRIHTHEGEWRLEPVDGGRATRARYHFRLDLAGSLPGWMARGRMADDVPELFDRIREQVTRY